MLVLTSLIFLAVTCAVLSLVAWFAPTRAEQRFRDMSAPQGSPGWTETVVRLAGPLARLSSPEGEWETSPLRVKLFHAGLRHPDVRLVYFAAKTVLPLLFAGLAFMALNALNESSTLILLLYVCLAALAGCYLPNFVLWWMTRSRQREIFENFPDATDLLLVCIEAGLGLDAGLGRVSEEIRRKSTALAQELHLTNLEIRAGGSRNNALHNLALRTGVEEISTFATMLNQADRFGTSIGDSLRVFSDDLRHKRQTRAEETAAKVPTKMLFPLVLCIFPSIIMVIMGPAAIQVIRTIIPILGKAG